MTRVLGALSAIAFLCSVGAAYADEMAGTVQSWEEDTRTIVLEDGTSFAVSEAVSMEGIEPGDEVLVSFEEQDDQMTATEIKEMSE